MARIAIVGNMLKRIGQPSRITSDLDEIARAKKLVLPGVGAFEHAMEKIDAGGFCEVLNQKALVDRVPILGICSACN